MDLEVSGKKGWLLIPEAPAEGKPWIWRARFPTYHNGADEILLKRGYHIAYINTGGLFGSPAAMEVWDQFYEHLRSEFGLSEKVALEGVSRGGLFVYAWAKRHPNRVARIFADTPVCDFKSWPLGQGSGIGAPSAWSALLEAYEFDEAAALAYDDLPIDRLDILVKAEIPLLHLVSTNDQVVPPAENTDILADRYEKLGGEIEVLRVEGTRLNGHHFDVSEQVLQKTVDFLDYQ